MTLALFQTVGATELLIVLAFVLVIFGPKRLPALGRMLGSGFRDLKESITSKHDEETDAAATPRHDHAAAELDPPAHVTGEPEPVEGEVVSEKR